ncbi:putative ATP synthase protein YMF19 [Bienertia sinuspersici]
MDFLADRRLCSTISIHLAVHREYLLSLPGNPMVTLEEGITIITEKVLMSTLASDSPTRSVELFRTPFEINQVLPSKAVVTPSSSIKVAIVRPPEGGIAYPEEWSTWDQQNSKTTKSTALTPGNNIQSKDPKSLKDILRKEWGQDAFVPDIPVLEQPLINDDLRRAQLYNRLAPHSFVQQLPLRTIVDLVYQQAEVEKRSRLPLFSTEFI